MNLKQFKKLQKNGDGNVPVMIHVGGGVYEELTEDQVRFDILEDDTFEDQQALFLGGEFDEPKKQSDT